MFTCPFQKNINILEGWVESKFIFIYTEDVLLKYTVQHSAHLVRKCGSVCVLTHLTPPPPHVLFIMYVIGAMLEDWQKIGHNFESIHPIDTFISYLVQIGTHGFREAFLNNRLRDMRCLVMAKPHISYKC